MRNPGKRPINEITNQEFLSKTQETILKIFSKRKEMDKFDNNTPEYYKKLTWSCWESDLKKRPTARKLASYVEALENELQQGKDGLSI